MMRTVVDKVRQLFQKAGLYFQIHYLPTEKDIYLYLKNRPLITQYHRLKKICELIRLNKNHALYTKLLSLFVPDRDLEIKKAAFIGSGKGEGNMNIYRKVEIKDKLLFEKIYYTPSVYLKKNLWFYRNVYHHIKDKIKTADIEELFISELLTMVYFQYLSAERFSDDEIENYMIKFSKCLYQISLKESSKALIKIAPDFITNYQTHFHYCQRINNAKRHLRNYKIDCNELEFCIEQSRRVFTHCDMNKQNLGSPNILVDWDHFGVYPMAFEVSFVFYRKLSDTFYRSLSEESRVYEPLSWLEKHYKSAVLYKDWGVFERNFLYFLYVFCYRMFKNNEYKIIERNLIKELKVRS